MTAPALELPQASFDLTGQQQEQLQDLSSSDIDHIREKCKTDLYFLAKGVLGYNQLEPEAHGALCQFLVQEPANRRMVLMPRGHLKTTICTISDSIRLSLVNPDIRILIQNEVLDNAIGFLSELKAHWEKGKLLKFLFPELDPKKYYGPGADWSQAASSLVRESKAKESTYTASGSGGSPQSQHFEVIKNDDLIGERQKNSQTEMLKAIAWTDAMTPLLDRLDGQMDYYGTRKTLGDAYAHLMEKFKSRLKVFVRLPIENDQPIFSKFPLAELQAIMTDTPDVWAYDYMNNPIGKGGLDWGRGLLRQYSFASDGFLYFEHHITGKPSRWHFRELDVVTTIDPNSGKATAPDKAAVVTRGTSPADQVFCLSSRSGRWSPDELVNMAWEDAGRWHPRVIGFEEVGQQNTMYYFEKKMQEEGLYYRIQGLPRDNQKTKEQRIRAALDTPLKARRTYVLASQLNLISQIQLFPSLAAHNWDEIDCFSFGPELGQKGISDRERESYAEAEEKILSIRRGVTGYGRSV